MSSCHYSLPHCSLQQQMVSGATDLNKAAKDFMSENMKTMVNKALVNEPGNQHYYNLIIMFLFMFLVVKMLYLSYYKSQFRLSHMTDRRTIIDKLSVRRSKSSYSPKRMMYYAPRFRDYHNSKLAIVAFNMEKIFPCLAGKRVLPVCRLFTAEEDGFRNGRPIIEAADGGNNFQMFNQRPVYAFAIKGCQESCVPEYMEKTITCMLPRKYCPSWTIEHCMQCWM